MGGENIEEYLCAESTIGRESTRCLSAKRQGLYSDRGATNELEGDLREGESPKNGIRKVAMIPKGNTTTK